FVVGIVMEQDEALHAGAKRESHGVFHSTVAPAGMFVVFFAVVLGVQNQHVGITDEINHLAVVAAGARFGVRKKTDEAVGRKTTVADAEAGMVGAVRADKRGADGKIEFAQFLDFDVARQLGKGHGEIGAFHLAGESGDEALAGTFATE